MTRQSSRWVAIGKLTSVAFEFTGTIAAGAILGVVADRFFDTDPWLLIGFTLLGTTAGFTRMVQILRHFKKRH